MGMSRASRSMPMAMDALNAPLFTGSPFTRMVLPEVALGRTRMVMPLRWVTW